MRAAAETYTGSGGCLMECLGIPFNPDVGHELFRTAAHFHGLVSSPFEVIRRVFLHGEKDRKSSNFFIFFYSQEEMDVILTGRNMWMLLEDYKRLKQEYRSMQFSKPRGRNGRAARKWEKFVKAFCRIEFQDELELLNLYKTALHPVGKKKVAVFRSKK